MEEVVGRIYRSCLGYCATTPSLFVRMIKDAAISKVYSSGSQRRAASAAHDFSARSRQAGVPTIVTNLEFDNFGIEDAQRPDSFALDFAKQA